MCSTLDELAVDELAGVVDLYGGMTREDLRAALTELAFKRDGQRVDDASFVSTVDEAIDGYYLVETDHDGDSILIAGPSSYPTLPEGAADLPHILDVPIRSIERGSVGKEVLRRLEAEVDSVFESEQANRLVDVSYDLEAWAPIDASSVRDTLSSLE